MTMVPFRVRHIKTGEIGTVVNITNAYNVSTSQITYTWYDINFDNGHRANGVEAFMVIKLHDSIKLTSEMTEIPLLTGVEY